MSETLLVLDPGHGGRDPGSSFGGLKEKDLTLKIAKGIRDKLKGYKIKVMMTRETDRYMSLRDRTDFANRINADLLLSIHINAGGGTGFESFIYNGRVGSKTVHFQKAIHSAIVRTVNKKDRGMKRANFHMLRESKMAAVLTESLFIDGDNGALKKDSVINKIIDGHVKGILSYLGIKGKTTSSKPSKSNKKSTQSSNGANKKKNKKDRVTKVATNHIGKRVENIYHKPVRFYSTPRWDNPSGRFNPGHGWTIVGRYKVGNGYQYKVKNSKGQEYFITASSKYVKVIDNSKTKRTVNNIKVGDKVKIKPSARNYARGGSNTKIPNKYKGKRLTVQQVGTDDVLIKEVFSWVKKSDIQV